MIKKILLLCFLLFTFAHTGFAHTGLETSFPQDGEVVTEPLQEIVLNFETKIEQGSTFNLTTANGQAISLSTILLNENQMKATVQQPLENGDYQVHWDIIGADGHPIEGEFSFVIEMEQTEEDTKEDANQDTTEEPIEEEQETKDETSANPPTSTELPETDDQQQSFTISILIIILVIMSLISVGTFIIIFKRKN
ncbi:copper resistance protein CopC [Cytobacillus sp. FJAT-54145]|uniref:Copper resistance protein CopC n=1 Tax=Cytobacillus spartinae TaxID=3299023 RepID=A0ABW6KAF2_9BACI